MTDKTKIPSNRFLFAALLTLLTLTVLITGVIIGLLLRGPSSESGDEHAHAGEVETESAEPLTYTCSMHPSVRLPDPEAKCPICFMDLIPIDDDGESGEEGEAVLSMSEAAMRLADIHVTPVKREATQMEVRMVGSVDYDETRLATISVYVPARLDRLYVDYTGIPVRKGDHLVSVYSPELLSAEAELLANLDAMKRLGETASDTTRRIAEALIDASREKLRLWGLTADQISRIEQTRETSDHITIFSPIGGVVTQKHKVEGEYVKAGEGIYSVADLSHLWIRLDAYESDLHWIRYGQEVEFTTEAYPGEIFHGKIAFIDPLVSEATRTVKLRVNVDNTDGRLKPGMFVRATVRPIIAGAGEVVAEDLAGLLICPMHPEIVKDGQAPCDICGMDLVPAEEMGYVVQANDGPPPLIIPASAPMITGKRAIVYVKLPDREKPTFEGRSIVLGPRAGDYYIVREDAPGGANLDEGDLVVVSGNFKIDSALQIQAATSMMNPPAAEDVATTTEVKIERLDVPGPFLAAIEPVYADYLDVQTSLAGDELAGFQQAAMKMQDSVKSIEGGDLGREAQVAWDDLADRLLTNQQHIDHIGDIEDARKLFEVYSKAMIELSQRFGYDGGDTIVEAYCPMAFDFKGASWLQLEGKINNPYFGASMLRCGEITRDIEPADESPASQPAEPEADTESAAVNDVCPVMGNPVDPDTPMATWRGHKIGFCCAGCDGPWEEKTEQEKDAFLARYVPDLGSSEESGDE